jgi:hypothetical protein
MDHLEIQDHQPRMQSKSPSYLSMLKSESFGPISTKKLSPGVNFINISRSPFSYKRALRSFSLITVWICNIFSKNVLELILLKKG